MNQLNIENISKMKKDLRCDAIIESSTMYTLEYHKKNIIVEIDRKCDGYRYITVRIFITVIDTTTSIPTYTLRPIHTSEVPIKEFKSNLIKLINLLLQLK
jgi:hypothetical protein